MGPEEVIVCYEQDCECDGTVKVFKAASGASVELVGAIESFDDLFVRSKL